MYEGPEFRHLRYFVAIAEERNFNRAARRLHVAQPSLSAQIRQLEEGLSAKLFTRTPAGALLTVAGAALLPHAKQILRMREHAVEETTLAQAGLTTPFRLGYSPWLNHNVIHEAIAGYKELVPGSTIQPSSQSSGPLMRMVLEGQLSAALINLPVADEGLYVQYVCSERLLICMRADDPAAMYEAVPRTVVQERLKVMFERALHPLLYEQIERRLDRAGVKFSPTDFVSHPADVQFLIQEGAGFGLVRDSVPLTANLVRRPMAGLTMSVKGAFICLPAQQRPVLPLLAYRVAKFCSNKPELHAKKPAGRVELPSIGKRLG